MSETTSHVIEQLSAFVDNQLNELEQPIVEAHLAECESCRKHHEEMVQLREALLASPIITPPDSFYEGVLSRIEDQKQRKPWLTGIPIKAVASACVVMLVVWVAHEKRRENPPMGRARVSNLATVESISKVEPQKGAKLELFGTLKDQMKLDETRQEAPVAGALNEPLRRSVVAQDSKKEEDLTQSIDELQKMVASVPPAKPLAQRKDVTVQARDMGGMAAQNSFDKPVAALKSTPVTGYKGGALQQSHAYPKASAPVAAEVSEMTVPKSKASMPVPSVPAVVKPAIGTGVTTQELNAFPDWKGVSCGITEPTTVIIQSASEWQTLWKAHYRIAGSPTSLPYIDFDSYVVVGIYAGQKPTSGYTIEITEVRETGGALAVYYREATPPPGSKLAAIVTQPYHLKAITKNTLPIQFKRQ